MKNKRTYEIFELTEADKTTLFDRNKNFGIKKYVGGVFNRVEYDKFETKEEAENYIKEYCSKYYLSDYADDEIEDFYNSIDFTPMIEQVNKLVGVNIDFDIKLTKSSRGGCWHIEIEGKQNLADYSPILACAWKDFRVSTFASEICCDKETGELYYGGDLDYSYEHLGLGHNGARIMDLWYKPSEGGWIIITEQERAAKRAELDW